ncbi:tyrosine-protein phosphatase [Cellulomonas denverensis]|uniref:Tyrosine-protein phosphatase n=1 Tax=Cellulomonas denverensis TaxID=264297 RepID=A0A7X6KT30_9CELL|nr:tyrosine-protein phosphatase [Cellulomonas denverensis]NKY21764.1 tyrosine-protein phosphatase [Cellulomonas denverensis]GIG25576.1 phosphotyrosine protein phosphatase [Cellulomonas denverensis]
MTTTPVLSPPVNLRDLAGTPVAGGTVRPGMLWRADDMSCVTEEWATQAVSDGLSHVVDLRSAAEAEATGRGPLGRLPVSYHHVPIFDTVGGGGGADQDVLAQLARVDVTAVGRAYLTMLRENAPAIVALLGMIAAASGVTVVHCAAGKDRTGVLVASVLTALGAEQDTIVADYGRTADNLHAIYSRIMSVHGMSAEMLDGPQAAALAALSRVPVTDLPPMMGADPRSMAAMLDLAREEDGGLEQVLRAGGLTDGLVTALRHRLVDPRG